MKLADRFGKASPYFAWLLVSSALLVTTRWIDPNVFGITAYGTAGVSIVLISLSLMYSARVFLWALASAVPTVAALALS